MSRGAAATCAAMLALLALPGRAAPPPQVEIAYELMRNGSAVAEVSDRLEHDGRSYRLTETWRGKGVYALLGEAVRTSRGAVVAGGLRPLEFEDRRTGRDIARASFDWKAKSLTLQFQGEPQTRPLPPGAHDRLSFLYGLAFHPPGAQPTTFNVADGKGVSTYVYRVVGHERVNTPAGEFDSLKVVKQKENPQDRGTEIWLAVERHYLPVRILVTEKDGSQLEQLAVRIGGQ